VVEAQGFPLSILGVPEHFPLIVVLDGAEVGLVMGLAVGGGGGLAMGLAVGGGGGLVGLVVGAVGGFVVGREGLGLLDAGTAFPTGCRVVGREAGIAAWVQLAVTKRLAGSA